MEKLSFIGSEKMCWISFGMNDRDKHNKLISHCESAETFKTIIPQSGCMTSYIVSVIITWHFSECSISFYDQRKIKHVSFESYGHCSLIYHFYK